MSLRPLIEPCRIPSHPVSVYRLQLHLRDRPQPGEPSTRNPRKPATVPFNLLVLACLSHSSCSFPTTCFSAVASRPLQSRRGSRSPRTRTVRSPGSTTTTASACSSTLSIRPSRPQPLPPPSRRLVRHRESEWVRNRDSRPVGSRHSRHSKVLRDCLTLSVLHDPCDGIRARWSRKSTEPTSNTDQVAWETPEPGCRFSSPSADS